MSPLCWILIATLPPLPRSLSLAAAEAALAEFDAEAALSALKQVEQPLELEDNVRFHAASGIAHAYLGHEAESLAAFGALLALDPGYVIPYTLSPKVTFLFQRARREAGRPPAVDFSWPRDRRVGESLPVIVEVLHDPMHAFARARLFWRAGKQATFTFEEIALPKQGAYATVELPADGPEVTSDQTRQLFLTVYDSAGNEVGRLGDPERPREVTLRYEAPTHWYETWWIWVLAGAVTAAGAGSAVYFATRPAPSEVPLELDLERP